MTDAGNAIPSSPLATPVRRVSCHVIAFKTRSQTAAKRAAIVADAFLGEIRDSEAQATEWRAS